MTNYHHFNKDIFLEKFSKTETFSKLTSEYTNVWADKADIGEDFEVPDWTPRVLLNEKSIFLYSIFYYLDFLLEKNPKVIADIGCGINYVKNYIPNVVGYDVHKDADHYEIFDYNFIHKYSGEFDAAFAINSIHFRSLHNLSEMINDFGKIIAPGGRGYITANLMMLIKHTQPHEWPLMFDLTTPLGPDDYCKYINSEIEKVDYKILAFDTTIDETLDDMYNGNIRIVFEK